MGTRPLRRRSCAVLTTATLAATGWLVAVPAPPVAAVETDQFYQLVSVHSGKAIDIEASSTEPGAMAVQWDPHDEPNQQFQFVPAGDGYYRIVARHSGLALDVYQWNPANGAEIRQWTDLNGTNQQWQVVERGGGAVSFHNRFSGKALDLWGWSTANGARISQYDPTGAANQQWQLVPVDGGGGGGGGGGGTECGAGTFHAEVFASGGGWTARTGGNTVYSGGNLRDAMQAAVNSLTPGRTVKQRVVVWDAGSISAGSRVSLPSFTTLDVCGTIQVTGSGSGDQAPVYARGVTDVEVQHLSLTGSPLYGIFMRNVSNVVLGQIDLRLSSGLGIRIDNHGDRSVRSRNIRIDDVYVEGTSNHGVETYGVDGLTIGTVVARDTGFAGLLLNDTINAEVGLVDAVGAGTGTGYAAFRMANRNGRIGGGYPTNIHVGEVRAQGGGRGIFCVSESGGAVIDRVTIAQTGGNAMLIENCYNVRIAAQGGSVTGPGDIRIAARSEFPNTADVTLENLTVTNSAVTESPCSVNLTLRNNTLVNSPLNTC